MLTRKDIILRLREIKPVLRDEYSVKKIGLFGSFSEDESTEESDIDLLVELEKPIGWKFLLWNYILKRYLDGKLTL